MTRALLDEVTGAAAWSGGLSLRFEEGALWIVGAPRELPGGVRLARYEVEVTGVSFPLDWSGDVLEFRQRRCRASRVVVEWTGRALRERALELLEGRVLPRGAGAPARIERAALVALGTNELEVELELERVGEPDAWVVLLVSLEVATRGPEVTLRPTALAALGPLAGEGASLWRRLLRALAREQPGSSVLSRGSCDIGLAIDPVFCALAEHWIAAGWKPPATRGACLAALELVGACGLRIDLRDEPSASSTAAAPAPSSSFFALATTLERARAARAAGDVETLGDHDAELVDALRWLRPRARRAVLRERVALWRGLDETRAWEALAGWVTACPEELTARRALALALARAGELRVLASRLAHWAQRPQRSVRARWWRRLAWGEALYAGDEIAAARRVLEPLGVAVTQALGEEADPSARVQVGEVLLAVARARAADARIPAAEADEAFARARLWLRDPWRRCEGGLALADAWLRRPDEERALAELGRALARTDGARQGRWVMLASTAGERLLEVAIAALERDASRFTPALARTLTAGALERHARTRARTIAGLERAAELRASLRRAFAGALEVDDWCEEALVLGAGLGRRDQARACLRSALRRFPGDSDLLALAASLELTLEPGPEPGRASAVA